MKSTILLIVFILCMIISWLFFTGFASFFAKMDYVECLRNQYQLLALIFIYWWCPGIFVCSDIEDKLPD